MTSIHSLHPDTYKLMLERTVWTDPAQVNYIQAIAADDATLVNLYREYVESRFDVKDEINS